MQIFDFSRILRPLDVILGLLIWAISPSFGQTYRPHGVPLPTVWKTGFSYGEEIPETGDFNGDGLDDLITFNRSEYPGSLAGDAYVSLNTGGAFGARTLWHPFFGINDETLKIGDFNGDGKDDLATFLHGTSGVVYVALSNGSGFGSSSIWIWNFAEGKGVPYVGDFNGDGRDDILSFEPTSGEVRVALSNGSSAFSSSTIWRDGFGVDRVVVGDFDDDGYDDLAGFQAGSSVTGDVLVAKSEGDEFGNEEIWAELVPFSGTAEVMVGQFSGSGGDDLAITFRTGFTWMIPAEGDSFLWEFDDSIWQKRLRNAGEEIRSGKFNRDRNEDFAVFVSGGNNGDVKVGISGDHAQPDLIDPVTFGYGTLGGEVFPPVGSRPSRQEVPMVLGLFEFSDRPAFGEDLGRDKDFFDSLFFGPGKPNLIDWFAEMSRQSFTFSKAGIFEIEMGELPEEDSRPALLQALADAGFDFRLYDTDGDGVVRPDELCIAGVSNYGVGGGQSWWADLTIEYETGGNIRLKTRYAGCDHLGRVDLYAHEVAHHFRMVDLYSSSCYNKNATLAHCNALDRGWDPDPATRWDEEESDLIHLDGWHATRFGWIRPKVYDLRNGPGFTSLRPPQISTSNDRAVILYDGSVGTDQYYLMEYRTSEYASGEQIWNDQNDAAYRRPDIFGDYPFAGYDSDVERAAIYPWFVTMESQNRHLTELVGIHAGDDGILGSTVLGDDVVLNGEITPGPDTVLQSVVDVEVIVGGANEVLDSILTGDDEFLNDRIYVGPNGMFDTVPVGDDMIEDADSYRRDETVYLARDPNDHDERGQTSNLLLDDEIGEFGWRLTSRSFQTGANVGPNTGQLVWGDPFRPFIEQWPTSLLRSGTSFAVSGKMGPEVGVYRPTLQCEETGEIYRLVVNAWGVTDCVWTIPEYVPPGEYLLYIRQGVGEHPASVSNTVSIQIEDSWQVWLDDYFSPTEQGDVNVVGEEVDLDGDGLSNLEEWVTGGNPRVKDPHLLPTYGGSGTSVYVQFPRRDTLSGVTVIGERSLDLINWYGLRGESKIEDDYLGIVGLSLYRVSTNVTGDNTFIRLRYSRAER